LIPKLVFEWYINPTSFLLSFASIFIVGIFIHYFCYLFKMLIHRG
jgi:hypothetical protein